MIIEVLGIGEAAGAIQDLPTVKEVMSKISAEAEATMRQMGQMIV
jgi:hypothetical protein